MDTTKRLAAGFYRDHDSDVTFAVSDQGAAYLFLIGGEHVALPLPSLPDTAYLSTFDPEEAEVRLEAIETRGETIKEYRDAL